MDVRLFVLVGVVMVAPKKIIVTNCEPTAIPDTAVRNIQGQFFD
jgi:hypothetical protein